MTLTEGVMGADCDRFELNPCSQTAALPCCTASRWLLGAEGGYELCGLCAVLDWFSLEVWLVWA